MFIPLRRPALWSVVAAGALTGASGALATSASAATISANKRCYVNKNPAHGAPMRITGSGFIPGTSVDVEGNTVFATAPVGPTGTFSVTTDAPILPTVAPATKRTTITVNDTNYTTGQTLVASRVVRSANLAVSTKPSSVRHVSRNKVRYKFSGFVPGKHIYGFWLRKKVVAHHRFGKAKGPCGTLKQKALMFPGGHPHHNHYTVAFESHKKYKKHASLKVTGKMNIFRY